MAAWSERTRGALVPAERVGGAVRWRFAPVLPDEEVAPAPQLDPRLLQEAQRQAFEEGFATGRAEALLEAQARMDAYVAGQGRESAERLAALFGAAQRRLCDAEQTIARGTLEIACALARQVLRHELATTAQTLEPVVREALALLLGDGRSARVRLSPADFDSLAGPLRAEFAAQSVTVLSDPAVAAGDCLVESAGAVVDGGVALRWERAVASLGLALPWLPQEPADAA